MAKQSGGYALFCRDRQISKAHRHRLVAAIEAIERGAAVDCSPDWSAGLPDMCLAEGYEIRLTFASDRSNLNSL